MIASLESTMTKDLPPSGCKRMQAATGSLPDLTPLLAKGLALHQKGRRDQAKACYRRVLDVDPNNPQALHLLGIAEYDQGHLDRSVQSIQAAIKLDPEQADYFLSLGNAYQQQGLTDDAADCYRRAIRLDPSKASAYFNLALVHQKTGRMNEAVNALTEVLATSPAFPGAHRALGQLFLQLGQHEKAFACFQDWLRIDPGNSTACFYLGVSFNKAGRLDDAYKWFAQAVSLEPDLAEAHLNMGLIAAGKGDLGGAARSYARALKAAPDMPEAYNNLGNLHLSQGQVAQASACYEAAIRQKPDFKDACLNLANSYRKSLNFKAALEHYNRLLVRYPDLDQVHNGLGVVYKDMRCYDEAIVCFQKSLELNPESTVALDNLAAIYGEQGECASARAHWDRKLSLCPNFADQVKRAMTLPVVYDSAEAIDACRQAFESDLDRLRQQKRTLTDPYRQIGLTNFILALHGKNERPIREKIARFYLEACPDLNWTSPFLKRRPPEGRIKIGMVSRFFHNNTIGSLYHGLIEKLSKERFHLVLFRLPGQQDRLSEIMHGAADQVVTLAQDIKSARERIARERLDILFYPELGMDALTYFIAFSRLAPVQCKRGFQITMGIPTIDYFISSDAAEPDEAQCYYSESLVRLKGTGYYYYRPEKPQQKPERASFGLPEDRTLYLCPQSLFKLHPDFDTVLAALLKSDSKGDIVLLEGIHPQWKTILMRRFEKVIPDACTRIRFLPRLPRESFLNLYLLADAVIDTLHFSGGHTSLECFAWGIPVVTWPGSLLPGRLTYGFYKEMGVMDCVAWDQTAYVDIAFRLANDLRWRREVGRRILERSPILFENMRDVRELEDFFEKAVTETCRQCPDRSVERRLQP